MPDALEQFAAETIEELLKNMTVKERLKGLSPEDLLPALEPILKTLSTDELLAAMSPETRAALAQRLKDDGSIRNPEGKELKHDEEKQ